MHAGPYLDFEWMGVIHGFQKLMSAYALIAPIQAKPWLVECISSSMRQLYFQIKEDAMQP